jgi:hypothetical protein
MGLDMYLQGHQYQRKETQMIDDFPVKEIIVELGYWRKHPNLHGAIIETFAEGVDDCRNIELNRADIEKLIEIIKSDSLPHTEGFFFGASAAPDHSEWYEEQKQETIKQLDNALKWYDGSIDATGYRWVIYRASW